MAKSSIFVVEDDGPTRDAIGAVVRARAELHLAGAVGSYAEARAHIDQGLADVLLVDLQLPDGDGLELIRLAREHRADALVMVVTVLGDEQSLLAALAAGATGYIHKGDPFHEIGGAILALLAGGSPMSPSIARHLLRQFAEAPAGEPTSPIAEAPTLTPREQEALRLIAKGFTYAEIADLLEISTHTVTGHLRNVYAKLEVRSRSAAVYEAVNLGLIRIDD